MVSGSAKNLPLSFEYLTCPFRYTNDALGMSRGILGNEKLMALSGANLYERIVVVGVALSSYLAGTLLIPVTFAATPFSFTADVITGALHYYKVRSNPEEIEKLKTSLKSSFEIHALFMITIFKVVCIWSVVSLALSLLLLSSYKSPYTFTVRFLGLFSFLYLRNWPVAFESLFKDPELRGKDPLPYIQFLPEIFSRFYFEKMKELYWDETKKAVFENAETCLSCFSLGTSYNKFIEEFPWFSENRSVEEWEKAERKKIHERFHFSDLFVGEESDSFAAFKKSQEFSSSKSFFGKIMEFFGRISDLKVNRFSSLLTDANLNLQEQEQNLKDLLVKQKLIALHSVFNRLSINSYLLDKQLIEYDSDENFKLKAAKVVGLLTKIKKDPRFYDVLVNLSETQMREQLPQYLVSFALSEESEENILAKGKNLVYKSHFSSFSRNESKNFQEVSLFLIKSELFLVDLLGNNISDVQQIVQKLSSKFDSLSEEDKALFLSGIKELPKEIEESSRAFSSLVDQIRSNNPNIQDTDLIEMLDQNPSQLLGVNDTPTEKEIDKAFRKNSLKHHPDKNPADPHAFLKQSLISAAKDVLLSKNPIEIIEELYQKHFMSLAKQVFEEKNNVDLEAQVFLPPSSCEELD